MCKNDTCPITLEPLADFDDTEIYEHADVGFLAVALYEYLERTPYFTNPVNRLPLGREDLERLEANILAQYGEDAIVRRSSTEPIEISSALLARSSTPLTPNEVDWLDEGEVVSRMQTTILEEDGETPEGQQRTIRLRVDIDMTDVDVDGVHEWSPGPSTTPDTLDFIDALEQEEDEDRYFEDNEDELDKLPLPPRRTFASVVEMYHDAGRQRRMCERLSLLQFLEYEAMNQLRGMMDLSQGQEFHRFVWHQTSMDVIDTVTMYLNHEPSEAKEDDDLVVHEDHIDSVDVLEEPGSHSSTTPTTDYNLEVQYTECWELYRTVVMQRFQQQYEATMRDILSLGRTDFEATLACHRSTLHDAATEEDPEIYASVLDFIHRLP